MEGIEPAPVNKQDPNPKDSLELNATDMSSRNHKHLKYPTIAGRIS